MKSRQRKAIAVFLVVLAVAAFREPLLRTLGRALVVNEELAPSDVVVIPEWTQAAGALEAADIFRQGLATGAVVLLDTPDLAETELIRRGLKSTSHASWLLDVLKQLKVEPVETIDDSGNGTQAETVALPQLCERHGWRRIIVVSLSDHSRRLQRLLRRSMRDRGFRVIVRTSAYSSFDPDTWWRTRDGIRIQLLESQKLLLDILLHPFS